VTEPAHHFRRRLDRFSRGYEGPADHHNRQREIARGLDFCRGRIATGVLGHDDFGAVIRQHGAVIATFERPARHDHLGVRQRQRRAWRVYQPDQIGVLRMRGEGLQILPADAEKHPAWRRAERFGRRREIVDLDPAIAGRTPPGWALQRQQRHAGHGAGGDRVRTHLRSERMGGVDDARNLFGAKIGQEAIDAAKAAEAPGNRRGSRVFGAAGIGQYRVDIRIVRHHFRQTVGVGGAAKDQDAQLFGREECHDHER
jgi:hypothetical protein